MEQEQFSKLQRSVLFRFFDRLSNLVIVNGIMILFSICGLILFGLYPALFAATSIFNEALEKKERNTFSRFWKFYKQHFIVGNFLMVLTSIIMFIGYKLVFEMSREISVFLSTAIYFLFFIGMILVVLWNLYLPAITVLYPEFSFKKKLLFSVIAGLTKWGLTLKLLLIYGSCVVVTLLIPQLMMFIFLSVFPWFSIWITKYTLCPDSIPQIEK